MNRRLEYILVAASVIAVLAAGVIGYYGNTRLKDAGTYMAAVAIFNFFLYKLIAGWLFINLSVKAEAVRVKGADGEDDHLSVKVILAKGTIDSLWLEDIEIRLGCISQVTQGKPVVPNQFIRPFNFKKLGLQNLNTAHPDYWNGPADSKYVMSTGEETVFSAYTRISPGCAYSAEIVVVGKRPFYSVTRKQETKIQWRASLIVLPQEK